MHFTARVSAKDGRDHAS